MAEFHLTDGTAYAQHSLVKQKMVYGYLKIFQVALAYGTNGFYLKFENASDLGNDSSGNNNDYTVEYGYRPSSS